MRKLYWVYPCLAFVMLASVDEPSCGGSGSTGDVTPTVNITNNNCNINGGTGDCNNSTVNQGAGAVEEDLSNVPPLVSSTGDVAYAVERALPDAEFSKSEPRLVRSGPRYENKQLTPEQYAYNWQAETYDGQYIYRWDQMPLPDAEQALLDKATEGGIAEIDPGSIGSAPAEPDAENLVMFTAEDRRVRERRNTRYPFRALVSFLGSTGSQLAAQCTATLIGNNTALGAAHCFYRTKRGGGVEKIFPSRWAPAGDGEEIANPFPWVAKSATFPRGDGNVPVLGCYLVTTPRRFREIIADKEHDELDAAEYDVAVIRFGCGVDYNPGSQLGYFGRFEAKPSGVIGGTASHCGFPAFEFSTETLDPPLSANQPKLFCQSFSHSEPSLQYIRRLGDGDGGTGDPTPFVIHSFDSDLGQSGGPVYMQPPGAAAGMFAHQVTAIDTDTLEDRFDYKTSYVIGLNIARAYDSDVRRFVRDRRWP
jgi:hypothetical protein